MKGKGKGSRKRLRKDDADHQPVHGGGHDDDDDEERDDEGLSGCDELLDLGAGKTPVVKKKPARGPTGKAPAKRPAKRAED